MNNKNNNDDPILLSLINFLIPVIFLYGTFFIVDFLYSGFSSLIYALTLFVSGYILFLIRTSKIKSLSFSHIEYLSLLLFAMSILYLVLVLLTLFGVFVSDK